MKALIAIAALIASVAIANAQAPLCQRIEDGAPVPCYSAEKIERAVDILARRHKHKSRAELRDMAVSIEMNRGAFASAKALAGAVGNGF